jgi:hypothetical protein
LYLASSALQLSLFELPRKAHKKHLEICDEEKLVAIGSSQKKRTGAVGENPCSFLAVMFTNEKEESGVGSCHPFILRKVYHVIQNLYWLVHPPFA